MTNTQEPRALTCGQDHAELRSIVASPTYSHSTTRFPGTVWASTIWVYRVDAASPSGVKLDGRCGDLRCDECVAILRPHNGPTRGALAIAETRS